jgi:hypothetical protein
VADFGWRVNDVKLLISSYLRNVFNFWFWGFWVKAAAQQGPPPPNLMQWNIISVMHTNHTDMTKDELMTYPRSSHLRRLGILQIKQKQPPTLGPRSHTCASVIPVTSPFFLKIFTNHKSNCLWIKWGPCSIWQCHLQLISWNIPTLIPVNSGTNKKRIIPTILSIGKFSVHHLTANNCNNMPTWIELVFFSYWNIICVRGAQILGAS